MRVGVAHNDPWVVLTDPGAAPDGVEVELVEEFARTVDAEIEWFEGTAEDLAASLHTGSLDLVIAGLTSTSPFQTEATFTHPYLTTFTTIGVEEEPATDPDLTGVEVAVEAGTEMEGLLRKLDVVVVPVKNIASARPPLVVDSWLLDNLGLIDSGIRLSESDHVMAVPHGENAWLTTLERFLLAREERIKDLLEQDRP